MIRTLSLWRSIISSAVLLALLGCTYVPFDEPRKASFAQSGEGTRAAETSRALTGGAENRVALVPLSDGNDALGARFQMIENAERSIDIKTFLIKPDTAGALFWLKLFEAAERGVKVRLLYDDVFTTAADDQISTLDVHPNVEIRAYNPLSRNSVTAVNFMLDFGRVNRRMHNKAMIVDGSHAILGGRNIADEYYQIGIDHEFADFDLFVTGQPVSEVADAFDLFWNDKWAVPIATLAPDRSLTLAEVEQAFRTLAEGEVADIYDRAIESSYLADLRAGRVPFYKGEATVVVDDPDKLRNPPGKGPYAVGNAFYHTMQKAERDVLVMTPYFVPETYGAEFFEKLAQRGVRVRIVTNSLASTNHAYVHSAYARYRDRLLAAGVEFLEVRVDAAKVIGAADADVTMHTKLMMVDDRTIFVGSTNVDPRSIRQNSEIGMIIDSPEMARAIREGVDAVADDYAFKLGLDDEGNTVWRYEGSVRQDVFTEEPLAGGWSKFLSTVAGWLPIESQL